MKFALTLASSVRGWNSVSKTTISNATAVVTITADAQPAPKPLALIVLGVFVHGLLLSKQHQPKHTGEQNHDTRIKERKWTDFSLQATTE